MKKENCVTQSSNNSLSSSTTSRAERRLKYNFYLQVQWWYMVIHFPLFWGLSLNSGISLFIDCGEGHKWLAHYIMCFYALMIIIVDVTIYLKRPEKWIQERLTWKCKSIERLIKSENSKYIFEIAISFFAHMDIYTDICFIMVAQDAGITKLWMVAFVLMAITCVPKFLFYFYILLKRICQKNWDLKKAHKASYAFEMRGSIHIIDILEGNSTKVNRNQLWANMWKFFTEDLGQSIVQFIYVLNMSQYCSQDGVTPIVLVSLIISIIMGIYSVMSPLIDRLRAPYQVKRQFMTPTTKMDFRSRRLGTSGTVTLAGILRTDTHVQELNLSSNRIRKEGVNAIAESLMNNSTLTELNLYENNLGKTGTKAICRALRNNTTLKTLDLGYNNIGNEGAFEIAELLKENNTLIYISLWNNNIGKIGANAISKALEEKNLKCKLDLKGNAVPKEIIIKLSGENLTRKSQFANQI